MRVFFLQLDAILTRSIESRLHARFVHLSMRMVRGRPDASGLKGLHRSLWVAHSACRAQCRQNEHPNQAHVAAEECPAECVKRLYSVAL